MLRFSIRDLMWLTVVVGLAVLWWAEYRQRLSENVELRSDYQKLEAELRKRPPRPIQAEGLEALRQTIMKDNLRLHEQLNFHKMRADAYEAERANLRLHGANKKREL